MKLIKNISGQTVQLFLGTNTVSLYPNDTVDYSAIVSENPLLADFNLPLITSYIDQNILAIVSEMTQVRPLGPVVPEVVVNFSPAIPISIALHDTITFTNLTSIDLTNALFAWTFQNTTGLTQIAYVNSTSAASKDPHVTFNAAGLYSVTLIALDLVTAKGGSLVKTALISVV